MRYAISRMIAGRIGKNDVETGLLDFLIYVHQNWR
jgi:hypothetical protein